jgi:hypothetical protein
MKISVRVKNSLYIFAILALLTGCMGNSGPSPKYKAACVGDHTLSALEADKEKDLESELDEAHQLSTLYAGNAYFYAGNYETSLKRLDEAERIIKYHQEEILLGSVGDLVAQMLLNDAVIDYHATITDRIMVNTYKAMSYMALGQMDEARIEFNRAIDRQRRAKETYAKLIGKYKEAMSEKEKSTKAQAQAKQQNSRNPKVKKESVSFDLDKTANNPQVDAMIARSYPLINQFEVYPEFINPFTNYMAGIFFATQKDYTKASGILKEVYGMSPNSEAVKSDFVKVENILNGKQEKFNNVWIIYANGLAPKKEQYKINIPLFLFSSKVRYTGIALPKLVTQKRASANLNVFNQNKLLSTSSTFADMDRVILTEFKYGYQDVVTRAIFSTMIKTYIQYELNENFGQYAGMAAGIFQALTTKADTRVWGNLPKEYQVAKVDMPEDRQLKISVASQVIDIDLGEANNAIVFVRLPTPTAKISYNVVKL